MKRTILISCDGSLRAAWVALAIWLLLLLCLGITFSSAHACQPLPTCGDPGAPSEGCASPTPTLAWDYQESWQNDLIGYRVFYREGSQAWDALRSWTVGCWVEFNEDTGAYSRQFCYGTDVNVPVQRVVERDFYEVEYAIKAIDRNEVESTEYSNGVVICQPPLWRGGLYE